MDHQSRAPTTGDAGGADIGRELLSLIQRRHESRPEDDDPFRRIGGSSEIYCTVDLERRRVTQAASVATRFRGYETLLTRRDLREAGLVSSTASGICGGVHATASSLCLEMALGVTPPPLGVVARNLLLCCQYLADNPMHLFVLSGPDYSEEVFRRTNPEIWERAKLTPAAHASTHGYATVGELLHALERPTGALFVEALKMVGQARAAYATLGGKLPHSESIIPGGVDLDLTERGLDAFERKLGPFADYAKRCIAIWDEVFDFLYEANPSYRQLGEAPATMVDLGQWDHEDHYDASYERCDQWGEMRWSTPGAVVDGQLRTTRLSELNRGLGDFIDRSYYEPAGAHAHSTDPIGGHLGPHHPWNTSVVPTPDRAGAPVPYSWASALLWNGHAFEVGAYARLYVSALAKKLPKSDLLESTGRGLVFQLPAGVLPAMRAEWHVPPVWNAFERNRARAYAIAFNLVVTLENLRRARWLIRTGNTALFTAFDVPRVGHRLGAGFCGAGRGFLAHWAVIDDGCFSNYQIAVPSRINAGPRSPSGALGACERAVSSTPILESRAPEAGGIHGIDIVRVIQSFDPCTTCTCHIGIEGTEMVLERVVTTSGP